MVNPITKFNFFENLEPTAIGRSMKIMMSRMSNSLSDSHIVIVHRYPLVNTSIDSDYTDDCIDKFLSYKNSYWISAFQPSKSPSA